MSKETRKLTGPVLRVGLNQMPLVSNFKEHVSIGEADCYYYTFSLAETDFKRIESHTVNFECSDVPRTELKMLPVVALGGIPPRYVFQSEDKKAMGAIEKNSINPEDGGYFMEVVYRT